MLYEIGAEQKRNASVLLASRLSCGLDHCVRVARDGFQLMLISAREVGDLRSVKDL